MRNVSDKTRRENQNIILGLITFLFSKSKKCGKMLYSQTGHRRQFNTTPAHCMLHN